MGYDHRTVGFEKFDSYLRSLKDTGTPFLDGEDGKLIITDYFFHDCQGHGPCPCCRRLRKAIFKNPGSYELMVVEEWLAVEDHDCDGTDVVKLAVYRLGHRPRLIKQIVNPSLFESSNPELFGG